MSLRPRGRHVPPWTPEEIAHMRRLIKGGTTEVKKIAACMGKPYTGTIWNMMHEHAADLLPPKRVYRRRTTHEFEEARQPFNPLTDKKPAWLRRGRA